MGNCGYFQVSIFGSHMKEENKQIIMFMFKTNLEMGHNGIC